MLNLSSRTRAVVKAVKGIDGEAFALIATSVLMWLGFGMLVLAQAWR